MTKKSAKLQGDETNKDEKNSFTIPGTFLGEFYYENEIYG
jgi:hypothetical protein